MSNQSILRHEKKYLLSEAEYYLIRSSIQASLSLDPNADPSGHYFIRSIYYDTQDNKDFFEKLMGIHSRHKIRARVYNLNSKEVKIEMKAKENTLLRKTTSVINIDDYHRCHQQMLHNLGDKIDPVISWAIEGKGYRPVIMIDYEREAYVHPFSNIRINFDKNIRYNTSDMCLTSPNILMTPALTEAYCLMEVKFNTFLPAWLTGLLNQIETTQSSFSKYCLTRSIGV